VFDHLRDLDEDPVVLRESPSIAWVDTQGSRKLPHLDASGRDRMLRLAHPIHGEVTGEELPEEPVFARRTSARGKPACHRELCEG